MSVSMHTQRLGAMIVNDSDQSFLLLLFSNRHQTSHQRSRLKMRAHQPCIMTLERRNVYQNKQQHIWLLFFHLDVGI